MIRHAWRLWVSLMIFFEDNGVCHCGDSMRTHPVWDNHGPVLWPTEEDLFLRGVLT